MTQARWHGEGADADPDEIASFLGCEDDFARKVLEAADEVVGQLIMEEAERRKGDDDE